MSQVTLTIGQLNSGSVINFSRSTTADNINYVILSHYTDKFGSFTKVLDLNTNEIDEFMSHLELKNLWTLVKAN